MHFTSDKGSGNTIRSYQPGAIQLAERVLTTHTVLSAADIIENWEPAPFPELSVADFQPALDLRPEIILFGTGRQQRFPDIHLLTAIMRMGVAIEVMETHAACRTFNVLIGEKRAVVAALLVD
jgi:uncharacterized protein